MRVRAVYLGVLPTVTVIAGGLVSVGESRGGECGLARRMREGRG